MRSAAPFASSAPGAAPLRRQSINQPTNLPVNPQGDHQPDLRIAWYEDVAVRSPATQPAEQPLHS